MTRPKRLAAVLALLVAFVMLFSVLYIALEADHDCSGDDCVICAQLQICGNLLRSLFLTAALLAAAGAFCTLAGFVAVEDSGFSRLHTLIALKVKLSD